MAVVDLEVAIMVVIVGILEVMVDILATHRATVAIQRAMEAKEVMAAMEAREAMAAIAAMAAMVSEWLLIASSNIHFPSKY